MARSNIIISRASVINDYPILLVFGPGYCVASGSDMFDNPYSKRLVSGPKSGVILNNYLFLMP
jgi:hypothetical protein